MTLDEMIQFIIDHFRLRNRKVYHYLHSTGGLLVIRPPVNGIVIIGEYSVDFSFMVEVLEEYGL
ncbi:hypothetical protein AAS21_gp158 [Pantoea phage vB_PagS_AAS21]|uniref:Uncharacterized protein n=1 Tax=Pantoea phage vB_PagS_AAS21 TaxID=2575261 RepID=A0A4Y5P1R1_9CAUD|nr:hypothetical protein AAS21_gp158 [Pantoea phage vB_PagS_AAS21]